MSKIKRYMDWCIAKKYTNDAGEVVSMKHAEEYMKTQKYAKEHDKHSLKVAKNNENSQHE